MSSSKFYLYEEPIYGKVEITDYLKRSDLTDKEIEKHLETYDCIKGVFISSNQTSLITEKKVLQYKDKRDNTLHNESEFDFSNMFTELTLEFTHEKTYSILYGLVDIKANILIPFEFRSIEHCVSDLLKCEKQDGYHITDLSAEEVPFDKYTPKEFSFCKYAELFPFSEGLMGAFDCSKMGFIDLKGNVIIPFEYDYCYTEFHEGIACVCKEVHYEWDGKSAVGTKYGYIDHYNNLLFPFIFDEKVDFENGECINERTRRLDGTTYIDRILLKPNGEFVVLDFRIYVPEDPYYYTKRHSSRRDDYMDVYEGDSDALWNTD